MCAIKMLYVKLLFTCGHTINNNLHKINFINISTFIMFKAINYSKYLQARILINFLEIASSSFSIKTFLKYLIIYLIRNIGNFFITVIKIVINFIFHIVNCSI